MKNLVILFGFLFLAGCSLLGEKDKEDLRSQQVTLYAIRGGTVVYFQYNLNPKKYKIIMPEVYLIIEGNYTYDQYDNILLDGKGCGGVEGAYHIRRFGNVYYLTSSDECVRYYYLTGLFMKIDSIPNLDNYFAKAEQNFPKPDKFE